jgi:hypothetical protein
MRKTIFPAALVVSSFSERLTRSAPALSSRSLIAIVSFVDLSQSRKTVHDQNATVLANIIQSQLKLRSIVGPLPAYTRINEHVSEFNVIGEAPGLNLRLLCFEADAFSCLSFS